MNILIKIDSIFHFYKAKQKWFSFLCSNYWPVVIKIRRTIYLVGFPVNSDLISEEMFDLFILFENLQTEIKT